MKKNAEPNARPVSSTALLMHSSWRRDTGMGRREENSLPLPPLSLALGWEEKKEVGSRQNIRYIPYLPQRFPRQLLIHKRPNHLSAPSTTSSQNPALTPFPNYFSRQLPRGSSTSQAEVKLFPHSSTRLWKVPCPFYPRISSWEHCALTELPPF